MGEANEGPSDPNASIPPFGDEDTRTIVTKLAAAHQKAAGGATVWRIVGTAAWSLTVTVGLALAIAGLGYAQQAAVDHERVERHDDELAETRAALTEMQQTLTDVRESQARIEGRLEER